MTLLGEAAMGEAEQRKVAGGHHRRSRSNGSLLHVAAPSRHRKSRSNGSIVAPATFALVDAVTTKNLILMSEEDGSFTPPPSSNIARNISDSSGEEQQCTACSRSDSFHRRPRSNSNASVIAPATFALVDAVTTKNLVLMSEEEALCTPPPDTNVVRKVSDPSSDITAATALTINSASENASEREISIPTRNECDPVLSKYQRTEHPVQKFIDNLETECGRKELEQRLQEWFISQREVRHRARQICQELQNHLQNHPAQTALLHHQHHHHEESSSSASSLLIISGPTGSGKAKLATSLKETVEQQGGFFLTGKFDFLQRDQPFGTFREVFSQFPRQVLERGEDVIEKMRLDIGTAVGHSNDVLTEFCPSFDNILANSDQQEGLKATLSVSEDEPSNRFFDVFRAFLGAVCLPESPMVIVLEDLHYADKDSLEALANMASDAGHADLFLICTVDDSLASSEGVLAQKLREVQVKTQARIIDIQLRDLESDALGHMLASALDMDLKSCSSLTLSVFSQTKGNLFHTVHYLQETDLFKYDADEGRWTWDAAELLSRPPCSLLDFLMRNLKQELSPPTLEILKVASCLGNKIHQELVEHVMNNSITANLEEALKKGVLAKNGCDHTIQFSHDIMHRAVYGLIPVAEKELFHVEVGRRLWRQLGKTELDSHLFLLLAQFNIGRDLITRETERFAIASLCLHAGMKAASLSTFRIASLYLELGIFCVGDKGWRDEYNLTLALYNAGAEMEMATVNFERMDCLIDQITERARCQRDKVQALSLRMYVLGMSNQQEKSIDLGLKALKTLGEELPAKTSKLRLLMKMGRFSRQMKGYSTEQLLRLPVNVDEDKLACIRILQTMYLHAMMTRPTLGPLLTMKSISITLEHGLCAMCAPCFASYGMICIMHNGDIEAGLQYGQIALDILDRFGTIEYLPRVYAAYYSVISPWRNPINQSLEPLQKGYRIGLSTGDIEFATMCAKSYCGVAMGAGLPLTQIDKEWKVIRERMISQRQETALSITIPLMQTIHHFMGLTENPLASKGDICDFDEELKESELMRQIPRQVQVKACRMMLAYVFGDYDLAYRMLDRNTPSNNFRNLPPVFEKISAIFFECLTVLAMAEKRVDRKKNIRTAKVIIKRFDHWATLSPYNYSSKERLLQAELLSVLGKTRAATKNYICAIALARESGFLFDHALANERAGHHLRKNGESSEAEIYFRAACTSYTEWGACAKSKRLLEEIHAEQVCML